MSASGGKADIPDTPHQCPLMTQSRRMPTGKSNWQRAQVIQKRLSGLEVWGIETLGDWPRV
jgi:hypothetical protein